MLHALDQASGQRLWQAPLDAPWVGQTRFTVLDDIVLALTTGPDELGYLMHVFDAASGESLGQRQVPLNTTRLDVSRPSGVLIMDHDESGLVSGIVPRTGESRWVVDVSSPYEALFVLAGDLVLCDGGLAVHAETGEELWERSDCFPKGDGGLTLDEGFLCYKAGETAAVDLVFRETRTGDVVWRSPFQDSGPELVVGAYRPLETLVSGTTVFLPQTAGDRRDPTALDALTGEPKRTYDGDAEAANAATSVAGGFVLPTPEGTVCLAAADGAERWRDEAAESEDVRVNGAYAVHCRASRERVFQRWATLRVLGAENGQEVWTGQFDNALVGAPASDGELVVVLDGGGTVWALRA